MMNMDNSKNGMNRLSNGQNGKQSGVIAYLAKLGLADADLERIAALVQAIKSPGPEAASAPSNPLELRREELIRLLEGQDLLQASMAEEPAMDTAHPVTRQPARADTGIKLCIAEEQLVLKKAYHSFFGSDHSVELLSVSDDTSVESLSSFLSESKPEVLLLGLKEAQASIGKKLEVIRRLCPEVGLVLLFAIHDPYGMQALREYSNTASAGYAYLLKHNIDTAAQLSQVVHAVSQGRIIVDPEIMEELVDSENPDSKVLSALSPNELKVLSWMARGFANDAIAAVLFRDRKSVERQVSSIYSKLRLSEEEGKDARVGAALMYLKATGLLPRG